MASYNNAMIGDLGKTFGYNLSGQETDSLLNQTGGEYAKLVSYFENKKAQDMAASELNKAKTGLTSAVDPNNITANAQKMLEFQKTANQPMVGALQNAQGKLKSTYDQLIASIKGNQQVAENQQTLSTNNEMAKRGISSNSGMFQQEMNNSLLPVRTAFTSQMTDAFKGYTQDDINLALQLAQAQTGDPNAAMSNALGLSGQQGNVYNSLAGIAQGDTANALEMWKRLNPSAMEQAQINSLNNKTTNTDPLGLL
jgi:hypothetical protein